MIKAVFFDLDGVFIDSETYDQKLNEQFLKENNMKSSPDIFKIFIGASPNSSLDIWGEILSKVDPEDDVETFKDKFHEYHGKKRWNPDFSSILFPHAHEVVETLHKKGYLLACCSSSALDYVERALDSFESRSYFDLIVSGRDLKHGKPDPDIYLFALGKFGLTAEEAVVIEDSYNGILSAKRAGIRVIAKIDHVFHMDQSKADAFVDDLSEIPSVIETMNQE